MGEVTAATTDGACNEEVEDIIMNAGSTDCKGIMSETFEA